MAIMAKVTIFDDETGREFEKNRVILPCNVETTGDDELGVIVTRYDFQITFLQCHMGGKADDE